VPWSAGLDFAVFTVSRFKPGLVRSSEICLSAGPGVCLPEPRPRGAAHRSAGLGPGALSSSVIPSAVQPEASDAVAHAALLARCRLHIVCMCVTCPLPARCLPVACPLPARCLPVACPLPARCRHCMTIACCYPVCSIEEPSSGSGASAAGQGWRHASSGKWRAG